MFWRTALSTFMCLFLIGCLFYFGVSNAWSKNNEIVTYVPLKAPDVLDNPYIGLAPLASGGPYKQPHRLVYANLTWKELEPNKDSYNFDGFEQLNKLSDWADQDVKLIIRVVLDYPGDVKHMDIPDWLYKEINGDGTWYDNDYGKGFSPNYMNPKLIQYHKQLIGKLAERYDKDPRIAFIELGSLGHWGEWHTKNDSTTSIPFPKLSVSDQYVQPYLDGFKNKLLMMRRPHQIAKDNHMGLFNDVFGDKLQSDEFVQWFNNGYTNWLTNEPMPAMPEFWKTAPSGGEFANGGELMQYLQPSAIDETLTLAKSSHTSWLGPNVPVIALDTGQQSNLDSLLKTMGYRFELETESHNKYIRPGNSLNVQMTWNNIGNAPFYYKWPLELSLISSSNQVVASMITTEDIRTWYPGITQAAFAFAVPSTLLDGDYSLGVSILDPETGKPGIYLANYGMTESRRYTLGKVIVKN